jgi:hypothetical protein
LEGLVDFFDPDPVQLYAAGALVATPEKKPFIVIRFGNVIPQVGATFFQDSALWVHDAPGSYVRIESILSILREELEGPVPDAKGIAVQWLGESEDLADDERKTIVKNAAYRLVGRR